MSKFSHSGVLGYYYGANAPVCVGACRHYFRNAIKRKNEQARLKEPRYRACLAAGMHPAQVDKGKGHHGSHKRVPIPEGTKCAVAQLLALYDEDPAILANITTHLSRDETSSLIDCITRPLADDEMPAPAARKPSKAKLAAAAKAAATKAAKLVHDRPASAHNNSPMKRQRRRSSTSQLRVCVPALPEPSVATSYEAEMSYVQPQTSPTLSDVAGILDVSCDDVPDPLSPCGMPMVSTPVGIGAGDGLNNFVSTKGLMSDFTWSAAVTADCTPRHSRDSSADWMTASDLANAEDWSLAPPLGLTLVMSPRDTYRAVDVTMEESPAAVGDVGFTVGSHDLRRHARYFKSVFSPQARSLIATA